MSPPTRNRSQAGFGLLEVLIALAITATALAALVSGIGTSLKLTTSAARHERAASLARSYLALVSVGPNTGTQSGDAGNGYAWRATMRPLGEHQVVPPGAPAGAAAHAPVVTLYGITVRVTWQDRAGGGAEEIETQRLAITYPRG